MEGAIDIDAHFEPGEGWLDEFPTLKAKLPPLPRETALIEGVLGDLLRGVPADQRPGIDELLPPGAAYLFGEEKMGEEI